MDALSALQSVKLTGKMLVNQGQIEFAYTQTKKRPGQVRTELTLQGMTLVQAYDGSRRLEDIALSRPQGSRKDVGGRCEVARWKMPRSTDRWSIGKQKGSTVEYLGTEDVDGTLAHKLKVVAQERRRQLRLSRS